MSLGEIGGYISEDEEFEREEELVVAKKESAGPEGSEVVEEEEGVNYFDNQDSSSESSEEDEKTQPVAAPVVKKLPSARSILRTNTKDSVFSSEFAQAEAESTAVLEKHVKLTESVDLQGKNNLCHAYRKGACKRGNRCKFSHVLPGGVLSNIAAQALAPGTVVSASAAQYNEFGVEEVVVNKRKKRAGVTNSLIPPKKAQALFRKLEEQQKQQ